MSENEKDFRQYIFEEILNIKKGIQAVNQKIDSYYESTKWKVTELNDGLYKNLNKHFEDLLKRVMITVSNKNEQILLGTTEYIAKKEKEIVDLLNQMKKATSKKIELSFSCDGYELVKKQEEYQISKAEDSLKILLDSLYPKEKRVLIMAYGLLGHKTFKSKEIGEELGISSERVNQIRKKALVKCRHPSRSKLVKGIIHAQLKEDILGKQEEE